MGTENGRSRNTPAGDGAGKGWGRAAVGPQMLQVRRQLQVMCPGKHSKGFALVVGPPPKAELLLRCTFLPRRSKYSVTPSRSLGIQLKGVCAASSQAQIPLETDSIPEPWATLSKSKLLSVTGHFLVDSGLPS